MLFGLYKREVINLVYVSRRITKEVIDCLTIQLPVQNLYNINLLEMDRSRSIA